MSSSADKSARRLESAAPHDQADMRKADEQGDLRLHHHRRGSAGSSLASRLSADPANRWDVLIHMPAALTFPIGSRFYDWR